MKTLVYSGAHAEVEVPDAGIVAKRGVPTEFPDPVAKRLLRQDTWAEPESAADRKVREQAEKDKKEQDEAAAAAVAKVKATQAAAAAKKAGS